MSKEIYQKIKTLLSEPNPNKAAIAREVGVSVVQVRKVAVGGYEKKFGTSNSSVSKVEKKQGQKTSSLNRKSKYFTFAKCKRIDLQNEQLCYSSTNEDCY